MTVRRPYPIGAMPVRRIIEQASRTFGIPAAAINSRSRKREYILPRQAVCLAAYRAGWSTPSIGRILGGRDHSTILHARDEAWFRLDRDAEYAARFAEVWQFASSHMNAPYIGEACSAEYEEAKRIRLVARSVPQRRDPDDADNDRDTRPDGSARLLAALQAAYPERCAA